MPRLGLPGLDTLEDVGVCVRDRQTERHRERREWRDRQASCLNCCSFGLTWNLTVLGIYVQPEAGLKLVLQLWVQSLGIVCQKGCVKGSEWSFTVNFPWEFYVGMSSRRLLAFLDHL